MTQPFPANHTPRPTLRHARGVVWLLLAAATLPYANTLWNGFVYDDNQQILENPYVQSPHYLREILTTTVWSFQGEQGVSNYYRPLMMLSFLACWLVFGPVATGFHLVNVLLHAVVVFLVYEVARRLFHDERVAFVAALLFAVHPIHTEAVAWIAAVPDLQLAALVLLIFLLLLETPEASAGQATRYRLLRRIATIFLFALALLAKEPAMLFPALVVFFEHFVRPGREQTPWQMKAGRYVWLWAALALYLPMRIAFSGGFAPALYRPLLSWPETFLTSFALTAKYAAKLVWPAHLSAFYPFVNSTSLFDAQVLAGLGVLLIALLLFLWLWRRSRVAAFSLLWTCVLLAPVLNARWMPASVFAERYLYLPSVGFCWLVAWAGVGAWDRAEAHHRAWRVALATLLVGLAVAGATRSAVRNLDWRNDYALYTRTLEFHPDAHLMRLNLGYVYWRRGNLAEAEREWKVVLAHVPKNVVVLNNVGEVYIRQGKFHEAIVVLDRALESRPDYAMARINLGRAYDAIGEPESARAAYVRAVALSPLNPLARNYLGESLARAGRLAEAEEQFRKSLEARPTAEAAHTLGELLFQQGKLAEAEGVLRQAVELNPYDQQSQLILAGIYLDSGRKAEAIRTYQALLETDPANPQARAALERLRSDSPKR